MPLDENIRKKIIQEETAKFIDESFGGLDLSDYPQFNQPPMEEDFHDDRYSMRDMSGTGIAAKQLHDFLGSPDLESLERAAYETNDPDLVSHVEEETAGAIAEEFLRRNPEYWQSDANLEAILSQLAHDAGIRGGEITSDELYQRGLWTVDGLTKAYRKLLRAGQLQVRPGSLRELTEEQLQYCQLLCSRGDTPSAIANYVIYRLGKTSPSDVNESGGADAAYALLKKPEYRPLFEEACWWAFSQVSDYIETKERRKFIEQYTRNKFVTVALLLQAWELCKKAEEGQARHDLVFGHADEAADQTPMSFEDLTDEQISNLKSRTLNQYAKNILSERERRRRGIK